MNKIRELIQNMPTDRASRIKLFGAGAVVLVSLIWISYLLIGGLGGGTYQPSSVPESAAHALAHDLTVKLNEDISLNDVGFAVDSEKPLKLKVVGMVHSQADMEKLKSQLKVLRPEGDYEVEVMVVPR